MKRENKRYINFVRKEIQNELKTIEPKNTIILVVARFGNTRLLDNIWL